MPEFDLTVRNGTIATASDTYRTDIGVKDGRIAALASALAPGERDLDARGRLVLPGGVDSHCHVEQLSSAGVICADDFYSATVAAAFGGTTTIIPFAAQHRGNSILAVVEDYAKRAAEKAVIDYGFHLIIADPNEKAMNEELPAVIARGITSFKVYMTYDLLRITDDQLLDVLVAADRSRALLMVHAENHEIIKWIAKRLLERGHTAPKFHMTSHHPIAEAEATHRVIQLSRLLDVPVLIVHVSGIEAVQTIRAAQTLGARDLRRDLPAVSRAEGNRRRQARPRGREVVLQPAAARRGFAGRRSGAGSRTGRSRSAPPTTRRIASTRAASCQRANRRRSRRWQMAFQGCRCGCRSCFRRVSARTGSR